VIAADARSAWLAFVLTLASCRSIDSSPAGTLAVDLDADARTELCEAHTVFANYGCGGSECKVWDRQSTCSGLLASLPANCDATVDDVIACIEATCAQPCTTVCGVALWDGPRPCP
jgi:hypothetical protein